MRNKKISRKHYQDFDSEDTIINIIKPEKKPTREDFENTLKEKLQEELIVKSKNAKI